MNQNGSIFLEPWTRTYVKRCGFLSFSRNLSNKYKKQLLDTGTNAFKKVVHKAAEAKGEFIRNKTADKIDKTKICNWWKSKKCWRNNYSTRKKRRKIKRIKKSIIKMEHYKIFKLLNDSTVLKFVTKRWIEVNDSSSGLYSVNKNI